VRTCLTLALLGLCLLGACGGGDASFGSGTPTVALSVTTVGFGTEVIGGTSSAFPVSVTNSGTASLRITSIQASMNFGEMDDCGSTIAAGANCTIDVTFEPTAAGNLSGAITITDNATGSPHLVLLTGTGSLAGPSCAAKGQQCPPQFPPCCPGLTCVPASTRAFCE
jgi:hypothetical protein